MKKPTKARKYNSPKLQALLDEITPAEMEQTKVKMQLAARIEDMMNQRGWGKSEFAEKVGKNPSEVTKWVSGTQNFTIDVLTEIAFAFGVEIPVLFGRNQVQVVYRNEIVVKAMVIQPAIHFSTPFEVNESREVQYFRGTNRGGFFPLTPLYEA